MDIEKTFRLFERSTRETVSVWGMVTPIRVQNIEVWSFTHPLPSSESRSSGNSLSISYPVRQSASGVWSRPSESRISRYSHSLNQYPPPPPIRLQKFEEQSYSFLSSKMVSLWGKVTPIRVQNIDVWSLTQSIPPFLPSDSRSSRYCLSVYYPVRRLASGAWLRPSQSRILRYDH